MNKYYIFSIVILHYNNLEDTTKCIESLLKYEKNSKYELNIIVVDNNSTNNSGEELKAKYDNRSKIKVIINNQNVGFAKGNNIGFIYAMKYTSPDFIILSNNDVVFEQEAFFYKIISYYEKDKFAVAGPDVYNPITDIHQSPIYTDIVWNKKTINTISLDFYVHTLRIRVERVFPKLITNIRNIVKNKRSVKRKNTLNNTSNPVIHGACMIFSEKYINIFPDGLYSDTFMYGEENILNFLCQKNRLIENYYNDIQILHYEGKSTYASNKNKFESEKFKLKHAKDSFNLLKQLILSYNEEKE